MSTAANLINSLIAPLAATPPLNIVQDGDGTISGTWTQPWQTFFGVLSNILTALATANSGGYEVVPAGTSPFQPDLSQARAFQITLDPTGVIIENPAGLDLATGLVVFLLVQPGNCPGPQWDTAYAGVQINDPFTVDPGEGTYSALAFFVTDTGLVLISSLAGPHWPS